MKLNELLIEEKQLPSGKKGIVIFDIDMTLLKPNNIFILKKKDDKIISKLTPEQYDQQENKVKAKQDGYTYSYEEFEDPVKVKQSILTSIPYVNTLRLMDDHIKNGYSIGILTARGLENIVYEALNEWLKYKKNGKLEPIGNLLKKEMVAAINDVEKRAQNIYTGSDAEAKKIQLKKAIEGYDIIKFVDDSIMNIKLAKELIPYAKEKGKRFSVIDAKEVNK